MDPTALPSPETPPSPDDARTAEGDLAALERFPVELLGRYPALRPPPRGAPRPRPRAGAPDLLLVGPGGLSRLRRGR